MKTITDFKNKMKPGSIWNYKRFVLSDNTWKETHDIQNRICKKVQTNSFALTLNSESDKISWCEWPKKDEFLVINDTTIELSFWNKAGKIQYEFVKEA